MKYEVDVKFVGEGYSMRRVRVEAPTPEAAKALAIEEYRKGVVAVGDPREVQS